LKKIWELTGKKKSIDVEGDFVFLGGEAMRLAFTSSDHSGSAP